MFPRLNAASPMPGRLRWTGRTVVASGRHMDRELVPHGSCQVAARRLRRPAGLSRPVHWHAHGQHIPFLFGLSAGPLQSGHAEGFARRGLTLSL